MGFKKVQLLWAMALLPGAMVLGSVPGPKTGPRTGPRPGIDQLADPRWQSHLPQPGGVERVAVLTHHAAVDQTGQGLIALLQQRGTPPQIIFAPEHGLDATQDRMDIAVFREPLSQAPVHFFYGAAPRLSAEQKAQFDLIVVDLFDIGVRSYTYPGTVAALLESLRDTRHRVVVLDRPNPLGWQVSGPRLEENLGRNLFTVFELPYRHGMTLGELALWYDQRHGLDLLRTGRLQVIPVQGLSRRITSAAAATVKGETPTSHWIPPSPALQTPEQAWLYAWLSPFEALDLSVGREESGGAPVGARAFRRIGAPWISVRDAVRWARRLQLERFGGVDFKAVEWTQQGSKFAGAQCRGVEIVVKDAQALRAYGFDQTLHALQTTRAVLGKRLDLSFNRKRLDLYLGAARYREALERGEATLDSSGGDSAGIPDFGVSLYP